MGKTFDLLKQAEEKFQSQFHQNKNSNVMDSILCKLGIEEEKILYQNQNEIIRSLILLSRLIEKPEHLLDSASEGCSESKVKSKSQIMANLIYLKRIALLRYHFLFTKEQFENIRQASTEIHLENKRFIVEKSLYQLQIRDQVLIKEFEELFQVIRLFDISTSDTQ